MGLVSLAKEKGMKYAEAIKFAKEIIYLSHFIYGRSKIIASRCDTLVSLPMEGVVSSLNVSVATGVCLYEIARQRALRPT